jgi:hypothetical protein
VISYANAVYAGVSNQLGFSASVGSEMAQIANFFNDVAVRR